MNVLLHLFLLFFIRFPFFVTIGTYLGLDNNISIKIIFLLYVVATVFCITIFYYPISFLLEKYIPVIYNKIGHARKKFENRYGEYGPDIGIVLASVTTITPIASLVASTLRIPTLRTFSLITIADVLYFLIQLAVLLGVQSLTELHPFWVIILTILVSTVVTSLGSELVLKLKSKFF